MKILFTKNVGRQGQVGEVKEVANGFATFLINNGSAILASDSAIKQNQKKIEETKLKQKGEESMAFEIAKRLEGKIISLKGGANNKGSLYKAIHKGEILEALSKEVVVTVPDSLLSDISIKLTGKHKMHLIWKGDKICTFEIEIV